MSELHTDLTKEDLRHLQSVGQNDLVWVEIGVTGVGKSTLGNFLLGKDAFKVGSALKSVTDKAEVDCSAVNDQRMCIVDTPGFGDTRRMVTKNTEAENLASDAAHLIVELSKTMLMAQHGINAFFVVVRADSRELFSTMKLLDLLDILGNYWNHSILVFTHGKEFDKASEERQYAEFEAMLESPSCPDVWQALMEKVSNCYVIVEPEEWKDDKEYRLQKLTEFRKHTSHIAANSGPYNDTLHSLVREYIETAKLELRHEFSDVDSPEAQVAALQVAFKNITSMLYKLIRIKLAGGVDTELLQKMANVKEEQLTEVRKQRDLLYEQLLKEQEEKRRAQAEEEKAREEERKAKERERAMAEERRLALEREEKARKELEEYLKKPTFTERRIETKITRSGFYKWEYVHTAEAVDVATGIRAKAKNYKSKDGAKEHARANLKAILLERGVIRKD